jgi:hypothetical protein
MQPDPIVEEVRKIRDAHAARFHYDLDAIFLDIQEQEKKSGTYISLSAKNGEPEARIDQRSKK